MHVLQHPTAVRVIGATGPIAPLVNGLYEPLEAPQNARAVYRRVDAPERRLFYAPDGQWAFTDEQNGAGCDAYCVEMGLALPQDAAQWRVFDGKQHEPQASVRVTALSEQVACVLRRAARQCASRPYPPSASSALVGSVRLRVAVSSRLGSVCGAGLQTGSSAAVQELREAKEGVARAAQETAARAAVRKAASTHTQHAATDSQTK